MRKTLAFDAGPHGPAQRSTVSSDTAQETVDALRKKLEIPI